MQVPVLVNCPVSLKKVLLVYSKLAIDIPLHPHFLTKYCIYVPHTLVALSFGPRQDHEKIVGIYIYTNTFLGGEF